MSAVLCLTLVLLLNVEEARVEESLDSPHQSFKSSLAKPVPKKKGSPDEEVITIQLPSYATNGFNMMLMGTMNTNHRTLTTVLQTAGANSSSSCVVVFDFETGFIDVMPKSSGLSAQIYDLQHTPGEVPQFTLRILARTFSGKGVTDIYFEGNQAGEIFIDSCEIEGFAETIQFTMKEGIHKVNRVLFDF